MPEKAQGCSSVSLEHTKRGQKKGRTGTYFAFYVFCEIGLSIAFLLEPSKELAEFGSAVRPSGCNTALDYGRNRIGVSGRSTLRTSACARSREDRIRKRFDANSPWRVGLPRDGDRCL